MLLISSWINILQRLFLTRWNFSSRIVNNVKEYKIHFSEFFESVVDDSDKWWFSKYSFGVLEQFRSNISIEDIFIYFLSCWYFIWHFAKQNFICNILHIKNIISKKCKYSFDEYLKITLDKHQSNWKKERENKTLKLSIEVGFR